MVTERKARSDAEVERYIAQRAGPRPQRPLAPLPAPGLAGALSAFLPGAGLIYAEHPFLGTGVLLAMSGMGAWAGSSLMDLGDASPVPLLSFLAAYVAQLALSYWVAATDHAEAEDG